MRRLAAIFLMFFALFSVPASSLDLNSAYYAVYEAPSSNGQTLIYIVPKPSVLILASEPVTPITFMPQYPGFTAIVGADGSFGSLTQVDYKSTDMLALGAQASSYGLLEGDFNGDGRADFLLQGSGLRSSVIITSDSTNPSGAFVYYDFKGILDKSGVGIQISDVDGNGRSDIVASGNTGTVTYFANATNASFETTSWVDGLAVGYAGSVKGSFDVDSKGDATYTVDIINAGGSGDVKPQISLNYASSGENGIAGIGWSVGGLSSVTRCRQTTAQDGRSHGLTFSSDDRFCLDGIRLIVVGGAYGSIGAVYRLEIDDYSVITSHAGAVGNPAYFTVKRKDGSLSYYGNGNGSAHAVGGGAKILGWSISAFQDSIGNTIRFSYIDGGSGHRIDRIDYAYGVTGTQIYPSSTYIKFEYEVRPDPVSRYVHTYRVTSSQRLSAIRSYSSGVELRSYYLGYTAIDSVSSQSRLQKLFECVNSKCFSPTQFTWASSKIGYEENSNFPVTAIVASNFVKFSDINGDEKSDLIYKHAWNGGRAYYRLSTGTGWSDARTIMDIDNDGANLLIGDIDSDGRQDVLLGKSGQNYRYFRGDVSGLVEEEFPGDPIPYDTNHRPFLQDINNDQLVDLVWLEVDGVKPRLLKRTQAGGRYIYRFDSQITFSYQGFDPAQGVPLFTDLGSVSFRMADFNADGYADIATPITYLRNGTYFYEGLRYLLSNGSGFFSLSGSLAVNPAAPVDLNLDGYSDMLGIKSALTANQMRAGWEFSINSNAGLGADISAGPARPSYEVTADAENSHMLTEDLNHDSYPDIVYLRDGSLVARLFSPGAGTFGSEFSLGINFTPHNKSSYFADVDGDGSNDFILTDFNGNLANQITSIKVFKSQNAGRVSGRITSIDNGLGKVIDVTYKPLTDASVYARSQDAGALNWPQGTAKPLPVFDLQPKDHVVSSIRTSAPTANESLASQVDFSAGSVKRYRYHGLKSESGGRGKLGFSLVSVTDDQSGIVSNTSYRQDFPFTGKPISSEERTAQGVLVKKIDFQYRGSGVEQLGSDGTKYYRPYVEKITEASYDLGTTAELSYVQTYNAQVDDWGNVLKKIVSIYAANDHTNYFARTVTDRSYGLSEFDRQFSRVSRELVTKSRVGLPDKVQTTAFNYYNIGAGQGLLRQKIIEPDNTSLSVVIEYEYDGFGNKRKVTKKSAGMPDRYSITNYDPEGRYVTTTLSQFCSTYTSGTSSCSLWVDLASENVISRNAFGFATQVNGLNGIVTTIQHDPLGREVRRADNSGAEVTTTYSRGGQVAGAQYQVRTQTNTGGVSTDSFDALGRSIAKTAVGFGGQTIISKTEYDKLGRIKRQSQPAFDGYSTYWTTNTYDTLGRLIAQTVPATGGDIASSSTLYTAGPLESGLNASMTILTNALGQTRTEIRNPMGELIQVNDHLGGMVGYGYDALGQLVRTSNLGSGATILTDLEYDQLGRKIKMTDANKGTWFYQYNAFGELTDQYKVTSSTIYNGDLATALATSGVTLQRTHMDYDQRGRMIARADYREGNVLEGSASWIYDTATNGIGQLKQESGGGLTRTYSYDNLGRVNGSTHIDDSGVYMLTSTYDNKGRPQTQTDLLGTGSGTRNSYNSYGYLQSVTDLASNTVLYQVQNANQFGNTTVALLGNGGTSTWAYDDATGHLLNQKAVVGLYNLVDLSYTWDKLGNQTSRQDKGLVAGTSNYRNLQQSFCYDGLNRLIKTYDSGAAGSACPTTADQQDQRYDAFGNITWKTGIGGYTYGDAAAKPHTLTSTSGGSVMGATSYTYDKTGNMIADSSGRVLNYSVFDKPTLIGKGTDSASFAYGPDRNYYKRTDVKAGITTRTHHIGGVEKVIKSDNSYDIKRYIAGVAIWTHKFNSSGAQTLLDKQYTYKDVLGSTVLITDAVGGIKGQMAFDEWGKRVSYGDWRTDQSATYGALQVATLFTTQGYTGHDMLDAVGLIHMQGRIYDARLGRFVQADPIVQDATDLQAYNRYAYVRNNPLTLVDPTGFISLTREEVLVTAPRFSFGDSGAGVISVSYSLGSAGYDASIFTALSSQQETADGRLVNIVLGIDEGRTLKRAFKSKTGVMSGLKFYLPGAGAQKGQTYNPSDPNYHSYTLRTAMCDLGESGCSVRMVMGFTERESVPFETNPNTGEPLTLAGGNPIMHYSGENWSLNVTMDEHTYHPGQVLHVVNAEIGVVYLNTYGTGTGPNPVLNQFVGYTLFGKMHADVWTSVKAQQIGNYYSNLFGQ